MSHFYKRIISHPSAGICLALLGSALLATSVHAEDYVKSYSVSNRADVHVNTNDGSVSIVTGENKQVEFRVEYHGFELDKSLHIESDQKGDRVELTARIVNRLGFSFGNTRRLHIEVRMPKDADLQVETGDGSVESSKLSGNISIRTHDGSINASHLSGNIELRSGDGSLTVNSLSGVVRLHTGDGAIEGSDLDGSMDAYSGDGHVRLSGRFDNLKVKTGDGSIDTHVLLGSKLDAGWSIVTGSGSVDLALPNDLQVDLDATTGDGRISMDIPVTVQGTISRSKVRGKIGGGGQTLTIHTGDGSIHLKQA
jgi:DUF4097 and DUF4098 domain-containing protein YvlB